MLLSLFSDLGIPWGEILGTLGSFIILLLSIGNNKLKKILAETKANGGTTIKDQLTNIESSIGNLAMWVEAGHHLSRKPMFRADAKGNFVWVNTAFLSLTGRNPLELENLGWLSAVHEGDRHRVSRDWDDSINDHRTFQSDFTVVNGFSLEEKNVRARAFPVSTLGYFGSWVVIEELED